MDKLDTLRAFIGPAQRQAIYCLMRGEEGEYYREKIAALIKLLESMPRVYEQDGKGDQAIVYLHYFTGSMDWYITERDTSTEQFQAFGLADFGDGGELGYISIAELLQSHDVEIDLHWTPKPLAEVKSCKAA